MRPESAFSLSEFEIDSAAEQILAELTRETLTREKQAQDNPYARWFEDPIGFTECSAFSSSASEIDSAAEQILAELMRETLTREKQAQDNPYYRWFEDPIGFTEEHLLGFLWSKQKAVCRSVARNRRTAVKSCHDVGKTRTAATLARGGYPLDERFREIGGQGTGCLLRDSSFAKS
jgi:hypothetical protein